MMNPSKDGDRYILHDPVKMPKASGFLWNENMMLHATCQGYVTAQFMQPEPAKYSHPPLMEAKTFLLPEPSYYAHHPGRFVYVKDEESAQVFSAPYAPVHRRPDVFSFAVGKQDLTWQTECNGIEITMRLELPRTEPHELWTITVTNKTGDARRISVYPYFTVGYMSWMNQGGAYNPELQAVVCSSVTPYQKYHDYAKVKTYKDKSFLLAYALPDAWETCQQRFEGEGGIGMPESILQPALPCGECHYEMPVAVLQYRLALHAGESQQMRFVFGPAKDERAIADIKTRYADGFEAARAEYGGYLAQCAPAVQVQTPDPDLDNYINHWLPRQAFFHGMTNRLSSDPQTRNYIQDAMGMTYVKPEVGRSAFLFALSQQKRSGAMPDGILLYPEAELKFINQVPHSDHCVWLPICMAAYLAETADHGLLDEKVPFCDSDERLTVKQHMDLAVDWLIDDRDERGLNYIRQGDWNDPMNAVGYQGKGVSGWLTMGTAYAASAWADILADTGKNDEAAHYRAQAEEINRIINAYFWDGDWYARGITDDGVRFGVKEDDEGRIYLNSQSWGILCGAADAQKKARLMKAVEEQLESPYGAEMLAPAYTNMREDIGRLTQKYPGVTENGSVYNHASAFYIYALYLAGEEDHAYRLLRRMLPGADQADILRRGQLPVFIPNYYRGAYRQLPDVAGRSSHLFCTGTISWVYRIVVEGLFGVKGVGEGLEINPKLPSHWDRVSIIRRFRGTQIRIKAERRQDAKEIEVFCNGKPLRDRVLKDIREGESYEVLVVLPQSSVEGKGEDI